MIPDDRSRIASAAILAVGLAAAAAAAEPSAGGWRGYDKTGPLSTRRFTPARDAKPLATQSSSRPAPAPPRLASTDADTSAVPDIPPATTLPDPLAGTEQMAADVTGPDAESILARLLPPRGDSWSDWSSGLEPLHACGEPRALAPCVPPPPCHPADPPQPLDLVGVEGVPSCGPIYGGPCAPRTGSRGTTHLSWLFRPWDRFVDCFYRAK